MFNKKSIVFLFLLSAQLTSFSQCSQCKAVIESQLGDDNSVGKGINSGILVLMILPYVLSAILIWLFFGKKIKEKVRAILHR